MQVSVAILTLNEEADLPACLQSLAGIDDIHVVDSGSTDRTREIAQSRGAAVHSHPFKSFGDQRNWTLDNVRFKHAWILFLDADEQATPAFLSALARATDDAPPEVAGFYCCWKLMLYGRWLRFSDRFPRWQFRLLRAGRARFKDFGHGQKEDAIDGRLEYLKEPYLHFAFSKGWKAWMERHNRYSDKEAADRLRAEVRWGDLFSLHGSRRAIALKPMLSRVPLWPAFFFLAAYFLRLGFLDGVAGFQYAACMSFYEYLIQLKMYEARRRSAV